MLTLVDVRIPKDIFDSVTFSQKIDSKNFIPVEQVSSVRLKKSCTKSFHYRNIEEYWKWPPAWGGEQISTHLMLLTGLQYISLAED